MKQNPLTLTRWVLVWAGLGSVCGLFGSVYWLILAWLTGHFEHFSGLSLLIVMPLSGLLVGLVIHWLGNPGEIGLIIDNIHLREGRLSMRENPAMILSSLISIASGGSAGPEAPMVQVTGSFGTWFADRLRLQGEALRSFSIAGMASGFTVLFGAPLGGAIFALEILHHQHVIEYYEALLPAIVSSCAGYIVFAAITRLGIGPIWHFPQYEADNIDDFAIAILYGVIGAIAGWLFIILFRWCHRFFHRIRVPIYAQTTLAGLGLAILAILFPLTRYFGEHQIVSVVDGNFSTTLLIGLAVAKMFATCITVTGGWRGGIIIPLFFIGACLGKALATTFAGLDETLAIICLMAALNAAVTRTPISTTLLLSKLSGYSPFTPILFASLIGFFLSPRKPFISAQLKPTQHS